MSLLLSTVLQTRGPGTFLKFIRQPVCSNSEPCTKHNAYGDENTRVSLQFRMLTVNPVIQGWQTYSGKGQIVNVCVCVLSHFSYVQLFATPWTAVCQVPLSMGFSRQEYWRGLRPQPRDRICISSVSCTGRWILYYTTW